MGDYELWTRRWRSVSGWLPDENDQTAAGKGGHLLTAEAYRAKYTQAEIDALGAKGKAFKNPDGHYSYPIADKNDLENAIHAVGRGDASHDSIRRYIIRRAKALGASDMIPDSWNADGSVKESHDDGGTTGDGTEDGSSGGGNENPTGLVGNGDGSGSLSADEPHEERADDKASTKTVPGTPLDQVFADAAARDDACQGGCSCDACKGCQGPDGTEGPSQPDTDPTSREDEEPEAEERDVIGEALEKFGEMLREAISAPQRRSVQPGKPATRSARGEAQKAPQALEARCERRTMAFRMGVEEFSGKSIVLEGEPIVYNADYTVHDAFGAFTERMAPTVCDQVLDRTDLDCRFLFNHDGMPLARTTSGTLELSNSSRALRCRATLDERSSLARDLAVAIERQDLDQMSIGFIAAEDRWNSDFTDRTVESLADLLDVSAVTYPASPTTSIGLAQRALFGMSREARSDVRRSYEIVREIREGEALSLDAAGHIVSALERLYVIEDPGMPVARVREAFSVMRELRAGKKLSAANASFIQKAIGSLARADDVDIPDIVRSLQDVDRAVDEARDALGEVVGSEPKADPKDLDPELKPAGDERAAEEPGAEEAAEAEAGSDVRAAEIEAEEAAERRRIATEAAKAKLAAVKKRRR